MHRTTTRHKTAARVAAVFGAATMLAVAAPMAASAHVTVSPSNTAATSYSILTFSVGHGCEGSPTTALTFTVPESVESVTPTVTPGWSITTTENTVAYTAAEPLADGLRTTFDLSVKLPDLPAGERLEFPVLQECEVGSVDWAEPVVDGEAEPAHPSPSIVLTERAQDGHGHATTEAASSSSGSDDVLARVLGIAGLVLGTVGVMVGVKSRRKEVRK